MLELIPGLQQELGELLDERTDFKAIAKMVS